MNHEAQHVDALHKDNKDELIQHWSELALALCRLRACFFVWSGIIDVTIMLSNMHFRSVTELGGSLILG